MALGTRLVAVPRWSLDTRATTVNQHNRTVKDHTAVASSEEVITFGLVSNAELVMSECMANSFGLLAIKLVKEKFGARKGPHFFHQCRQMN